MVAYSKEQTIGEQIRLEYEKSRPSPQITKARNDVIVKLQRIIDLRWPGQGLRLVPFGSSVTSTHSSRSDIDLSLLDPRYPLGVGTPPELIVTPPKAPAVHLLPDGRPEWYNVQIVSRLFENAKDQGLTKVEPISLANVPLVKMQLSQGPLKGVWVDIVINNQMGVVNSDLIMTYIKLRPKLLPPLICAVKAWLKARGFNDPTIKGNSPSLSSYAIVICIIGYLQHLGHLPNLQDPWLCGRFRCPKRPTWTGAEPKVELASDEDFEPDRLPSKWLCTYFNPFYRFNIRNRCFIKRVNGDGYRAYIPRFIFRKKRIPPSLQAWRDDYSEVVELPQMARLPPPGAVALHIVDREDQAEADTVLGLVFTAFITNFFNIQSLPVTDKVVYDIRTTSHTGVYRRGNTPEHIYEPQQPVRWVKQALVIADPFVQTRNVTGNISRKTVAAIVGEFGRAVQMMQSAKTKDSQVSLFARLCSNEQPEQPKVNEEADSTTTGAASTRGGRGGKRGRGSRGRGRGSRGRGRGTSLPRLGDLAI